MATSDDGVTLAWTVPAEVTAVASPEGKDWGTETLGEAWAGWASAKDEKTTAGIAAVETAAPNFRLRCVPSPGTFLLDVG
ncbi:hypothetical protein GCM10027562_07160 [Arthrobacter pigmenti]